MMEINPEQSPDGAELLDEVRAFLARFVAFPSEHAVAAVALWAVHTHLVGSFDSTPRLALLSPEKQSGKTRTLEIVELLAASAEMLVGASASFLFRLVGSEDVTILLDEIDTIWSKNGSDESAEALRGIVNAGHRKGARVGRVEMNGSKGQPVRFPVYAPVALAGIGNCLPDTVLDRSVIVRMRRRAPTERVEDYRERLTRPEGEALRDRIGAWAETVQGMIGVPWPDGVSWPDMPDGVTDRPADVWEPLLMVADLAGGDWPKLAREACVAFVTGSKDDQASIGVQLLADLRGVFGDESAMNTARIIDRLCELDESPWSEWNPRGAEKKITTQQLARLLKPYGVRPKLLRIEGFTGPVRGYERAGFDDAWTRYLPS